MERGPQPIRLDPDSAARLVRSLKAEAPPTPGLPAGYAIDRVLGEGGGGVVYRAFREGSDRPIALKIIRIGSAARRARRELELLESLRLPVVPTLLDYGAAGTSMFIAMELIDGAPLDRFAEGRTLRERAGLLARAAEAVADLHEHGVIHRDLKPSNILVVPGASPEAPAERLVLIDLGLASDGAPGVTITGETLGTPAYMSPEQARGERASTRSDVYSLGACGYALLAGGTPHAVDGGVHAAVRRVATEPPREPRDLNPGLARGLAAVLRRACDPSPSRRYASAAEFARDLRRWLAGAPVDAEGASLAGVVLRWPRRRPLLAAALAAAALLGAGFGGAAVRSISERSRPGQVDVSEGVARVYSSRDRRLLKTWGGDAGGFVNCGRIIPASDDLDAPLVIVGFEHHPDPRLDGALAVFRAPDWDRPLWTTSDEARRLPEAPPGCGPSHTGRYITVWSLVDDIIPERPGREILIGHYFAPHSQMALRTYTLGGELVSEVWHDGLVLSSRWVPPTPSREGMLLAAGVDSAATWRERGAAAPEPGPILSVHPHVVFAYTPRNGERLGYVRTPGGNDPRLPADARPRWYRYLAPGTLSQRCGSMHLSEPLLRSTPGAAATLDLHFGAGHGESLVPSLRAQVLDDGRISAFEASSVYVNTQGLPDPAAMSFAPNIVP